MGAAQSTQHLVIEDVLNFLEEEVKKWDDNIKNLKESWKEENYWVPEYVKQQIEETEIKWMTIKSVASSLDDDDGQIKYPGNEMKLASCCQEIQRKTEATINQLQKNNDTLIRNQQETELELQKLKEKSAYDLNIQRELSSKGQSAPPNIPGKRYLPESGSPAAKSSLEDDDGQIKYPGSDMQLARCCQEIQRKTEAKINQLKKSNDTLIRKQQETEWELQKLKEKSAYDLNIQRELSSKGRSALSNIPRKRYLPESVNPAAKSSLEDDDGQIKYPGSDMQLARCCQEIQRKTEAKINQLKKSNDTLIRKQQETEWELQKLKEKSAHDLNIQRELSSKRQSAPRKPNIPGNVNLPGNAATKASLKDSDGSFKYPRSDMQLARCCQEARRKAEAEINLLKKNNDTLLRQKNEAELELKKTKEKSAHVQNIQQDLSSKGQSAPPKPNIPGNGNFSESGSPAAKHSKQPADDIQNYWKAEILNRMLELEAGFEKEKAQLQAENEKLATERNSLIKRVEHIEQRNSDLLAGSKYRDYLSLPKQMATWYDEMYRNEWQDAYEQLLKLEYAEEEAIEVLKLVLQDVFQFCKNDIRPYIKKTTLDLRSIFKQYRKSETFSKILQAKISPKEEETTESYGMVSGRKKRAQDIHKQEDTREEIGVALAIFAQQDFQRAALGIEDIPELKPFILKCLQLGWMMAMQNPPVVFQEHHIDVDIVFDKDLYKEYKTSGPLIKFVVWPALLLHENGPLLAHGFAEGKQPSDIY